MWDVRSVEACEELSGVAERSRRRLQNCHNEAACVRWSSASSEGTERARRQTAAVRLLKESRFSGC